MKEEKKLKGFLQSGIIFVGDPSYMSGDTREGADNSQCNPFLNWDEFTAAYGAEDANLPFPGAFEIGGSGRGCAVHTGIINGKYELVKEVCTETGKLLQIRIIFSE